MRIASATVSAPLTENPRRSMAIMRRCRNARSSSTTSSDLPVGDALAGAISSFIAITRLQVLGSPSIPIDDHPGAAFGTIGEAHDRAEAPEQGLSDEEAEAHMAALALACGNIGFA